MHKSTAASKGHQRLYVLDTNVLMHDPTALFRFQEHDIFLPMVVLEELDRGKKGVSEVARNVRQVSRFIDDMMTSTGADDLKNGLPLTNYASVENDETAGRLFFQTHILDRALPATLPGETADNSILATALALKEEKPDAAVILVSKDINLRIKATVLGIHAEDYTNDKVLDDVDLLFANRAEITSMYETDDFEAALNRAAQDVEIVVATDSANGAYVVSGADHWHVPAFPTEVKDATGAGDLFAGAFLWGMTNGYEMETSTRMANLAASEIISHIGARPEADLKSLFKKHDLL